MPIFGPRSLTAALTSTQNLCVNWYLHAVEHDDGGWVCQHGRTVFDSHPDRASAVAHLKRIAVELGITASIFVHALNDMVEKIT